MSMVSLPAGCRPASSCSPARSGWSCRPPTDMLHAVHSNRAEELLAALLEALPPADPFAPSRIVVGSDLVARWLVREIALARGIASGLELLTFDRFLEQVW